MYVCICACVHVCMYVCLAVFLSVRLSACLSVCLSVCLPVCLFAFPTVRPSVCPSVLLLVLRVGVVSCGLSGCLSVFVLWGLFVVVCGCPVAFVCCLFGVGGWSVCLVGPGSAWRGCFSVLVPGGSGVLVPGCCLGLVWLWFSLWSPRTPDCSQRSCPFSSRRVRVHVPIERVG